MLFTQTNIIRLPSGRDHGDPHITKFRITLDHIEDINSIYISRHHHIQQHDFGMMTSEHFQSAHPIPRLDHLVAPTQSYRQQSANVELIIYNKYFFHCKSSPPITSMFFCVSE